MQTIKWGPGLWTSIHCMSFNYPENPSYDDKKKYSDFFNLLGDMLPCVYCRKSYKTYMKNMPIDDFLEDRLGCTIWAFVLHNLVNAKIGKPLIDFKECVEIYEKMRAKCGKVIENAVEYETCRRNAETLDPITINNFVTNATNKYSYLIKQCKERLNNDPENPNKEACLCRHKIYYDRF